MGQEDVGNLGSKSGMQATQPATGVNDCYSPSDKKIGPLRLGVLKNTVRVSAVPGYL